MGRNWRLSRVCRFTLLLVLTLLAVSSCCSTAIADSRSNAKSQIDSARFQLENTFQKITPFWSNITDMTRANVTLDLSQSYHSLWMSMNSYDEGFFNDSITQSVWSRFMAARAEYRVFLDMSWQRILLANQTITSIPRHIPPPTDALQLLANAISIYRMYYYGQPLSAIGGQPSEGEIQLLLYAEVELYFAPSSAFSYATRALQYAQAYKANQEPAWNALIRHIDSEFGFAVLTVFFLALIASIVAMAKPIASLAGKIRKRLGAAHWIPGVSAEFEKQQNLSALLRTSGTLLSAVVALLVIVSILNSVYASEGLSINPAFAISYLGSFLGPIIALALSMIFGGVALFTGPGKEKRWAGVLSFCWFIIGAALFAWIVYVLQRVLLS